MFLQACFWVADTSYISWDYNIKFFMGKNNRFYDKKDCIIERIWIYLWNRNGKMNLSITKTTVKCMTLSTT